MLRGRRFVRVHPRVWRCAEHVMSERDHVEAARMAMPPDAHLTGLSRLRLTGLEHGPARPVHFVVDRDHHIALDGIVLHRTVKLPPLDDAGVTVEAAFVAFCATARTIDAIEVGDWLLHRDHMHLDVLHDLLSTEPWRRGVDEARWVSTYLDGRCRSQMESMTNALLVFAGLEAPDINPTLMLDDHRVVQGDLVYLHLKLLVEYEGVHHQEDRGQYTADIDRYASLRGSGLDYVQVTKEKARHPRALVLEVHERMVARG